jgi:hypothetical protein
MLLLACCDKRHLKEDNPALPPLEGRLAGSRAKQSMYETPGSRDMVSRSWVRTAIRA